MLVTYVHKYIIQTTGDMQSQGNSCFFAVPDIQEVNWQSMYYVYTLQYKR